MENITFDKYDGYEGVDFGVYTDAYHSDPDIPRWTIGRLKCVNGRWIFKAKPEVWVSKNAARQVAQKLRSLNASVEVSQEGVRSFSEYSEPSVPKHIKRDVSVNLNYIPSKKLFSLFGIFELRVFTIERHQNQNASTQRLPRCGDKMGYQVQV